MNYGTVNNIMWPYDDPAPIEKDWNECQCGSINTFVAYNKMLVCRHCWRKEDLTK